MLGNDQHGDNGVGKELEAGEPEISFNAIAGTPSPNMMRLLGQIKGLQVVILVDSGCTHNFLDPLVAQRTMLKIERAKKLAVKMANGAIIHSKGYCDMVKLRIEGK